MSRLAALLLAAVALAGCGLGSGEEQPAGVSLTVSRNFGAEGLGRAKEGKVKGGETVMRLLQRRFDVQTRYGGGFVQEIEGVSGGRRSGRPVDWFYYVNGIEAEQGAAGRRLSAGDRVWWDHHDWGAAMRVPAVVGSFPEPFKSGSDGKRLPVRVDCAADSRRACEEVRTRLELAGVKGGGTATIGQQAGPGVVRIVVGRWADVRRDPTAQRIERGPAVSGVFARFDPAGRRLALLEPRGNVVSTLGAGAGLVAATRFGDQQPTWVVTGTDDVGVAAAAAAVDEDRLRDHFTLAVENGRGVPLPPPASANP
jgi:Domain of unknown function (DUF4430)